MGAIFESRSRLSFLDHQSQIHLSSLVAYCIYLIQINLYKNALTTFITDFRKLKICY